VGGAEDAEVVGRTPPEEGHEGSARALPSAVRRRLQLRRDEDLVPLADLPAANDAVQHEGVALDELLGGLAAGEDG
jgi:hypothetical protein